ncbi:MAG: HepT-like ribonuclease domain-containing protein [Dehalococcoidia bacterium]
MLQAARELQAFVTNRLRDDLDDDRMFRLAAERAVEIIGVAASRVSQDFRAAHPEVPWQGVIGQRNVIAHEYGDIILDRLWVVATERIPELIRLLEPLIPPPPEEP